MTFQAKKKGLFFHRLSLRESTLCKHEMIWNIKYEIIAERHFIPFLSKISCLKKCKDLDLNKTSPELGILEQEFKYYVNKK